MEMFKTIQIRKEVDLRSSITRTLCSFFIPGVNSGVYKPATLAMHVRIEELKAPFFGLLKKQVSGASLTLSKEEFDDLYNEMTKIKELRDNQILNK